MLRASVAAASARLDLRRTRGVRGRVVPLSWRWFDVTESMEKGRRRGSANIQEDSCHFLLNPSNAFEDSESRRC